MSATKSSMLSTDRMSHKLPRRNLTALERRSLGWFDFHGSQKHAVVRLAPTPHHFRRRPRLFLDQPDLLDQPLSYFNGNYMKLIKRILALAMTIGIAGFVHAACAEEAPDALVKRVSMEVVDAAKGDKQIQGGNQKHVLDLVRAKILPYVDFQRMTSLAAAQYWRTATPAQQQQLITQFQNLLVFTYSGAIASIKDQTLQFEPMRGAVGATDGVEVHSKVVQTRGEPIQLDYRLEKQSSGWKIYDMNIMGAWLVETYKGNFATEIGKGGIDGLIKTLTDRNKLLSDNLSKPTKS